VVALQSVILDVNALMMPFQFKINIDIELKRLLGECEVLVPTQVLGELRNLSKAHPEAKMALTLSKRYRVVESPEGTPDESIASLAKSTNSYVVTNDRGLIERLKAERVKVIRLRSRTHLVLEGDYA
jgi:rRNA-processing protein FCF1